MLRYSRHLLVLVVVLRVSGTPAPGAAGSPGLSHDPYVINKTLNDSEVVAQLKSLDAGVRAAAAYEVGRRKLTSAVPVLKELLADQRESVRQNAAASLLELGDQSGTSVLRDLLSSRYPFWALLAARALAQHGDQSGMPLARRYMTGDSASYRGLALKVLAFAKDEEEAYAALRNGLQDPANLVRLTAVEMATELGTPRSLSILVSARDNSVAVVRSASADAIASLGLYAGIPVLLDMMNDPDLTVVAKAGLALSALTRRPWATVPSDLTSARAAEKDWREWWEANKDRFPQEGAAPKPSKSDRKP